jgi:hypothetical protein
MKLSYTTSKDPKKILQILKSGYLTPNINFDFENIINTNQNNKIKTLYFNFYNTQHKNNFYISFILDSKFLLDKNFIFVVGKTFAYEHNLKTKSELCNLYKKNIPIIKFFETGSKNQIFSASNKKFEYMEKNFWYTSCHNILFENKVSLHDYLLEIFLHRKDEQLEDYIKANYPKCKINRVYNNKQYKQYLIDKHLFNFYSPLIDK